MSVSLITRNSLLVSCISYCNTILEIIKMEKADLLEDAKKSLSTAKSSLSTAINNADNNLVILKEEIRVARAAVNAANKRHAQLEKFTKSLCDDC